MDLENIELLYAVGGIGVSAMENSMEVSQKMENIININLSIPCPSIYLNKTNTLSCKDTDTTVFVVALCTTVKV